MFGTNHDKVNTMKAYANGYISSQYFFDTT